MRPVENCTRAVRGAWSVARWDLIAGGDGTVKIDFEIAAVAAATNLAG